MADEERPRLARVWESGAKGQLRREVAIFGAGIAGLTAAHELIERGYRVEVFEVAEASPLDWMTDRECDVGGKARTQWSRAERPSGRFRTPAPRDGEPQMKQTTPIIPVSAERVFFQKESTELDADARRAIDAVARLLKQSPGEALMYRIEVRGFCREKLHPLPNEAPIGRVDFERARAVAEELRKALARVDRGLDGAPEGGSLYAEIDDYRMRPAAAEGGNVRAATRACDALALEQAWAIRLIPLPMGLGLRDDWAAEDWMRDYVDFHVVEDWIPGEHGFRFFPSFYRNLGDTMRRTPIAVEGNLYIETTSCVIDNLVPTRNQFIALEGVNRSFTFPRRPVTLPESIDHLIRTMEAQGYTLDDVNRAMMRMFKYATSCPARRGAEYENISWWDFMGGEEYSRAFQKYFDNSGQTLLAMRTKDCDARTYGNITVQMMMDHVREGQHVDGTLNGPTSVAWFDHWRRYLERQGVEFRRGRLLGLVEHDSGGLWPIFAPLKPTGEEAGPGGPWVVLLRDYYVLAVGDVETKNLCAGLKGRDFDCLRGWELGSPTEAKPKGAHAHMSGIQYYFESDIEFVDGHIDYADAPWGLSSISQPQFWQRQRGWWSGYRGVLSVDVCDWFSPARKGPMAGRCAWESSRFEIAEEIWRQIKETAPEEWKNRLPEPILFHLDRNLVFDTTGERERLVQNRAPFLTNQVGEYPRRPGTPGRYDVYYGCLVLAGDFMQTYTRMTTMEAANESARHAVNAILEKDGFRGDRVRTWDPEQNEPAELKYFVDLDRRMFEEGLPHFMDVLDWTPVEVRRALRDVRSE